MKRRSWKRRVLTVLLAFAMVLTSVDMSVFVTWAASNAYEAASGTHGATYDQASNQVTFWVKDTDAFYGQVNHMWYKEYATYEEAAAVHITNGGNFIDGVPATSMIANTAGTEKSATVTVKEGTGAILYYINGEAGHARPDFEHIIVIETDSVSDNNPTGGEQPSGVVAPTAPVGFEAKVWTSDDVNNGKIWVSWSAADLGTGGTPTCWEISVDGTVVTTVTTAAAVFFDNTYAAGEHTVSIVAKNEGGSSPAASATFTVEGDTGNTEDVKYIDFEAVEHSDVKDAVDVTVGYEGTTTTVTGKDWGADWGGDSKWQIQLKNIIPVTAEEKYTISFTLNSEVARTVFLKLGDLNNDATAYIEDTITLEAGKDYVYTKETTKAVDIENLMVLFALGDQAGATQNTIKISNLSLYGENSGYVEVVKKETPIYIDFEAVEHSDVKDAVDVTVGYEGTTTTVIGKDWGADWGGDSKWQIQLKNIIPVTAGEKYTVSFTLNSEVARTVFLKLGDLNNDATAYIEDTITLEAGKDYVYTKETTKAVDIEDLMVLFALGDQAGATQNTIKISNMSLYGEQSGYVEVVKVRDDDFVAEDYTVDTLDRTSEGYDLIWNDEFNGTELDMDKWSFQIGTQDANNGPANWGNEEKQYYTDDNHVVADGKLTITAKKESEGGMQYTSTRIRTVTDDGETLFATKYGRIEARMKLPVGEGLWPAFWMLPENASIYGIWAASGELDIMEARGRLPGEVGGTIHYGSAWPNNVNNGKTYKFDTTKTDISGWHLYTVEWEPGKITWYVDDVPYGSISSFSSKGENKADDYTFPAPFDVPYYLVMNLAVGGTYDSSADLSKADFPASMEVDYVRVYQKTEGYDEENIVVEDSAKDTDSFNSAAFEPQGKDGDYIVDTAYDTLKQVTAVVPTDTDWQFFVGDFGGAATMTEEVIDGVNYAKIDVTSGGNQNYAVQLIKHLPLAEGYTYEISFDAKVSANRSIVVKPSGDEDNSWAGYGVPMTAPLTTEMTHYTHAFTMDKASDASARLEFNMGSGVGTIWIGNVTVKQIEASDITDNTDVAKIPLGDGNQIYNGTFDQGIKRLGFWHVENATATVPSVVGENDYSRKAIITATADGAKLYQKGMQLLQSDQYAVAFDMSVNKDTAVTMQFTSKDGSTVYMEEAFECKAADDLKTYKAVFAMPYNVTDKEGVFVLKFENGVVTTIDNISMVRTTKNNVTVDYTGVDLKPVPSNSSAWKGQDDAGNVQDYVNDNGVLSITAVNANINYARMILHPVNLTSGIQYKLSFSAKSDIANTYAFSVQEDNSWALTLGEEKIETTTEWKTFEYTFTSSLTNAGNPIYLKYLLSGPNVQNSKFYLKDVSLTAIVEESGCKEVPADAVTGVDTLVQGQNYAIQMSGAWKDAFVAAIASGKAVAMINETSLNNQIDLSECLNAAKDTLTIPTAYMPVGECKIELAMPGYFNAIIELKVEEVEEEPVDPEEPIDPEKPIVPEDPSVPETPAVPEDEPEFTLDAIEKNDDVPYMSITLPDDVRDIEEILREEDIAGIEEDAIIKFIINMATPSTEEVVLVENTLKNFGIENPKNAGYFDIGLWLLFSDSKQQIIDLKKKISVTLEIPSEYVNVPAGYTRTFWLVNLHSGQPIVLQDTDPNPETITVQVDGFSTFALVYEDTKVDTDSPNEDTKSDIEPTTNTTTDVSSPVTSPKTGDYNVMWALIALVVGCILYVSVRKDKLKKEDAME